MAPRRWSIATRLFALQLVFVVVGVVVGGVWSWQTARAELEQHAAEKSTDIALGIALNPFVVEQVQTDAPSTRLEPYALGLMRRTHTDFITIMAPDRTRYTHPDRSEIGRPFQGTIAPALAGRTFTETYAGTLGPSVRAVAPIRDAGGRVVALVAAGVTVANISSALVPRLVSVIGLAAAVVAVSALFSWLLSRYLRRVTAGRGPEELARVFASYEGVLHSVHEGLVVTDPSGAVVLHNDRAAELLRLPPPTERQDPIPIDTLDVSEGLRELLRSGDRAVDEVHRSADRVLVVNQEMAFPRGSARPLGTVTTFRDQTELLQLSGELADTRALTDALRTQTHEFANRLHAVVALLELGRVEEAVGFASDELDRHGAGTAPGAGGADAAAADTEGDHADAVGTAPAASTEPAAGTDPAVVVAVLEGMRSRARDRGVELRVDTTRLLASTSVAIADLITVVGNLVDNAVDAVDAVAVESADPGGASDGPRRVVVTAATTTDGGTRVTVEDTGAGIDDPEAAWRRGWSTKPTGPEGRGVGLGLVRSTVARVGGDVRLTTGPGGSTFVVQLPAEPTGGRP